VVAPAIGENIGGDDSHLSSRIEVAR
jgi:hypothetical protein